MKKTNNTALQIQPLLDFGPAEHCRSLHSAHGSAVAYAQLQLNGEWDALGTYEFEDAMALAFGVMPDEYNLYMSVNAVRPFGTRCVENITHLTAYFVDLDFYNLGLSFDSVIDEVASVCAASCLPLPTHVVDSGRGAYLIWRFKKPIYCGVKDDGRKRLAHWYNAQGTLIDMFASVGADSRCKDASRVLRLAGTVNAKSWRAVRFYNWGNSVSYRTVSSSIYQYYKLLRKEQAERYGVKPNKVVPKRGKASGKIVHLHTARTLMFARMEDLVKLAELRGGKLTDHREMSIFYYAISASCFYANLDGLLESVSYFISRCIKQEGKYDSQHPERLLTSVINKHLDKNKIREAGGDFSQVQYRARNETIIRELEITPSEQEKLSTIIGAEEKRRRNVIACQKNREAKGAVSRTEYLAVVSGNAYERMTRVMELTEQGFKQKEIADQLDISVGAVKQLKLRAKRSNLPKRLHGSTPYIY